MNYNLIYLQLLPPEKLVKILLDRGILNDVKISDKFNQKAPKHVVSTNITYNGSFKNIQGCKYANYYAYSQWETHYQVKDTTL